MYITGACRHSRVVVSGIPVQVVMAQRRHPGLVRRPVYPAGVEGDDIVRDGRSGVVGIYPSAVCGAVVRDGVVGDCGGRVIAINAAAVVGDAVPNDCVAGDEGRTAETGDAAAPIHGGIVGDQVAEDSRRAARALDAAGAARGIAGDRVPEDCGRTELRLYPRAAKIRVVPRYCVIRHDGGGIVRVDCASISRYAVADESIIEDCRRTVVAYDSPAAHPRRI